MKLLATALLVSGLGLFAGTAAAAPAHDDTHPESMQAVLPGQFFASVNGEGAQPVIEQRIEQATNCNWFIRPSRTSAIATCYNYSGSGSYTYLVKALAFDGCNRYIWFYGNVGWPFIMGKTSTARQSLVYTPPGTWYFVAAGVLIHKP